MIELSLEWLEALLCAASAGDAKAADMYTIASRISSGDNVDALDCAMLQSYVRWVEEANQ